MLSHYNPQKKRKENAQAIVEFAIVLPILLMLLVGILEVGRMIFIYAAVNNASREATRYASAWGLSDDGSTPKFRDCDGIRQMADRSAFFVDLEIHIRHDTGPGTTASEYCSGVSIDNSITVASGDRITIDAIAQYKPLINLVPLSARPFESISSRTILGILSLNSGTGSTSAGCTGSCASGATSTPTPTDIATETPTAAPTETGTPTLSPTPVPGATDTSTPTVTPTADTPTPGGVITFTPLPTGTSTPTMPPTFTPTATPTFTPTFTPTSTSTPVPGCDQIARGEFLISGNTMTMTIRNPHDAVSVSGIQVTWNSLGGPNGASLALTNVSLTNTYWVISNNSSGTATISVPDTQAVTIPGNNTTTTITFVFSKAYKLPSNNSVTISLSAPEACAGVTIHNP